MPDKIVGSNAGSKFWFFQTSGDCEEAAFDTVYGEINGSRLHEASVEVAAEKIGVLAIPSSGGSNWYGPNGLAKLGAHYGITMTLAPHKLSTIEADLAAGAHVIALVNAETIWAAVPANLFSTPPAGMQWDFSNNTQPDHALVVDSIDETQHTVTLTDSGQTQGALETVPLATFDKAVAASGYEYAIATKNGK